MNWKPIETAPKDQTEILLFWWEDYSEDGGPKFPSIVHAAWENYTTYSRDNHPEKMEYAWCDIIFNEPLSEPFTHWSPLPEGPPK